jgi:hypothetical protein
MSYVEDDSQASLIHRIIMGKMGSAKCQHCIADRETARAPLGDAKVTAAHLPGNHNSGTSKWENNVVLA